MSDVKITLPAGRYFVGDVSGISRPWVAIPARASVFYDFEMNVEVEIAGGGASAFVDENAFGVFGVVDFDSIADDYGDFLDGELGCFELTEPADVLFNFDYLEVVGVMKFSVARDAGLKFTDTDEAFDEALG